MDVLMVRSKIKPEAVADVRAATRRVLAALDARQPDGLRYAAFMQPDGETIVALRQVDEGVENPLAEVPEYGELLEIVEGVRAEPAVVERWTVVGSYRLY